MTPFVSIVIPCRNEARTIGPFLQSLYRQRTSFSWEAIIADGMSDDGTRDLLEAEQSRDGRIRVIDNPQRIVSTALNSAIRAARGEVIVRMDAHTEYADDYVEQCVRVLEETGADNVGGVPRVRSDSWRLRVFGAAYHSPFAVGGARSHDADFEGEVDSVFYGCWRKRTLEEAGLFDENLVRNQDDELNLRLTRRGGRIWQSARIVCWYKPRTRVRDLFRQYFQYGFWKVAVIRKHRMPASWRHLVPGLWVLGLGAAGLATAAGALLDASRLWHAGLLALGAVLVPYTLASLAAAAHAARRYGWKCFPALPFLFAVYHVSYGVGFLLGLVHWSKPGSRRTPASDAFVAISR